MYHAPGFAPVHFDDSAAGQASTRWLSGWQGPADQPAEQVTLGWALDETAAIVVATSSVARFPLKADRREDAVLQALGGQVGPVPLSARQRHQAMERARTVPDFEPVELTADNTVCTGAVSAVHGILVGHARVGTRVVTFAALGLSAGQIRLRTLDTAAGYAIDPRAAQENEAIEAQQPTFLDRR